jgi:hypothetical protein
MGRSSSSSSSATAAARVVCSGAGGCVRDYDDDKKNVSEEEEEEEDSIPAEEVEISAVSPSPPSAGVCALDVRVGLQEGGGASAAVGVSREGDNRAAARRARRLTPPRTFEYPIFTPVLSNETVNPPLSSCVVSELLWV